MEETMSQWIPVSERLPEEGHRVLAMQGDGTMLVAYFGGGDIGWESAFLGKNRISEKSFQAHLHSRPMTV
jgi:hypothetical protein